METVPDPRLENDTDAIVEIVASGVCGSDLWTYRGQAAVTPGARIGHEFVGVVVAVGTAVTGLAAGDWVISPFRFSDGVCRFCQEGLPTSCPSGGFWGREVLDAGQGELVRVPHATGTLVVVGERGAHPSDTLVPHLLTLADVMPTGFHAALKAGVRAGSTVVVVGDGAVGQCAVIAAGLLGAERVIVLGGRSAARGELARSFGADQVLQARGEDAVAAVAELTDGDLADAVVECVGTGESFTTALALARAGGGVGWVGVPHGVSVDMATLFARNISISGGIAPARHYLPALLGKVLEGGISPGRVFTDELPLEQASRAYQLMDERRTVKAFLTPSVAVMQP